MPLRGTTIPGLEAANYRSTYYWEREESPRSSFKMNNGQIVRNIFVNWDDRIQAELDFGGDVTTLFTAGGDGVLIRTTPHMFPGKPWMYVAEITDEMPMRSIGTSGGNADGLMVGRYDMCEMTLAYQMPSYNIKTDAEVIAPSGPLENYPDEGYALERGHDQYSRWISKEEKKAGKTLVLNKGMLKDEDNKLIVEGLPLPEPGGEVRYTWHQVPRADVPHLVQRFNGNSVNDATFDGYEAGTLLYDGNVEVRYNENAVTGKYLCDVTYRFKLAFKVDPVDDSIKGHNYIFRLYEHAGEKILRPRLVKTNGNGPVVAGSRMFRPFDFKKFFRPANIIP